MSYFFNSRFRHYGEVRIIPAKVGVRLRCRCHRRCYEKFSDDGIHELCAAFYKQGLLHDRRQIVSRFVHVTFGAKQRSFIYFLPGEASNIANAAHQNIPVCRAFFLAALNVTNGLFHYFYDFTVSELLNFLQDL